MNKITQESKDLIAKHKEMTSRDGVMKLPHSMAMIGYISEHHNMPRYRFRNEGLQYHYTDAAGLIGIIKTNRLWASHIQFLNDPCEGTFFIGKVVALWQATADASGDDADRKLLQSIISALANPRNNSSTFSISFCDEGDLLSQWRGYGSFGKGYAIGFNLRSLPHPQLGLNCDVIYGERDLKLLADDVWEIYRYAYKEWGDTIASEAASVLVSLAKGFKDESYSEERESRILVAYEKRSDYLFHKEAPLQFRNVGSDIVPYIPLALYPMIDGEDALRLPIKRIVTGPGVDFERNRISLQLLFREEGFEDIEIVPSRIPFRP